MMKRRVGMMRLVAALAIVLAIGLCAVGAQAATGKGSCGTNATWTLDSNGKLIISGTGYLTDSESDTGSPFYTYRTSIKTVEVESGITCLGDNIFAHCTKLTAVSLPAGCKLGAYSFFDCTSLTEVTVPDGLTNIDVGAFSYCTALTTVTIPATVTMIHEDAFGDCNALKTVYYGGTMAQAAKIDFQYSNTELKNAEWICSDSPVASGTCGDDLTWSLSGEGVLTISGSGAMDDYVVGSAVDPYDDHGSTAPWQASYRTSIKSVVIEDGVTSVGRFAFYDCSSLASIEIGNDVMSIGNYAFSNCGSLASLTVADGNAVYHSEGNCVLKDTELALGCKNSVIPSNVTSIGSYAFYGCSLTSIAIPDGVTSIGDSAFCHCSSLTSIAIPDGVTSIGDYAFCDCSSLTSITIPDSVTSIGKMAFIDCSALTNATIGNGVTSIGKEAF